MRFLVTTSKQTFVLSELSPSVEQDFKREVGNSKLPKTL